MGAHPRGLLGSAAVSALLFIPWFKLEGINIPGTQIGIQPFGVLVAIGVLAGARVSEWRAKRLGLKHDLVADGIAHIVISGFLLGHIFDVVTYYPEKILEAPWELLMPWKSLSSYGGFFGATLGGLFWRWRRGFPLTPVMDQVGFGMPLGWFFGRMGCFVVHDHPGSITDFPLAVNNYQYPGLPTAPRHDLGLYEVIWSAAVMLLFLWLDRKPRPYGFFMGWIAILYAPVRFGLDFLREVDRSYYGLTPAHYSSVFALGLGIYLLWSAYKRPLTKLPQGMLAGSEPAETRKVA